MRRMTFAGAILMTIGIGCNGTSGEATPTAAPSAQATSSARAAAAPDPSSSARAGGAASSSPSAPNAQSDPPREGSAIARSPDRDAIFVADEDHSAVRAIALPAEVKSTIIDFKAPGAPAQIVSLGDRLLVTVRQIDKGEGALLVLARNGLELKESARVELPVDAWGVTVTPDDKIALVTSAWSHKLSAVDLATSKVIWSIDTAREPRGVVVLPPREPGVYRAYINHLVGSDLTRVDFKGSDAPEVKRVELPAAPLLSPPNTKLTASLGYSLALNPKGDRLYVPRIALGALGSSSWFGESTVDVMLTADETLRAPRRSPLPTARFIEFVAEEMGQPHGRWLPGVTPVMDTTVSITQPRAAVYRRKSNTLLVASEGADALIELDALAIAPTLVSARGYSLAKRPDPVTHIPLHGAAPAGVVLSEDEDVAYVYCRATNDVIIVRIPPEDGSYNVAPPIAVALSSEEDKLRGGRAMFYNATESIISGGLACAGCHPEGRDDGFTWHEATITVEKSAVTNFIAGTDLSAFKARWGDLTIEGEGGVGYARQTPIIAGRVSAVGPYGWHGESKTLEDRIVAGFGLHRWFSGYGNEVMARAYASQLATFLRLGLTPPPRVERPLTDEERRGKALFESPATQCATCHVPATAYTDRNPVPIKGYKAPSGFAEDPNPAYKTPSLLFVGGSSPYFHDGRFGTLEKLIEFNQDRMGKTTHLSADDRKALIAFLRTL